MKPEVQRTGNCPADQSSVQLCKAPSPWPACSLPFKSPFLGDTSVSETRSQSIYWDPPGLALGLCAALPELAGWLWLTGWLDRGTTARLTSKHSPSSHLPAFLPNAPILERPLGLNRRSAFIMEISLGPEVNAVCLSSLKGHFWDCFLWVSTS